MLNGAAHSADAVKRRGHVLDVSSVFVIRSSDLQQLVLNALASLLNLSPATGNAKENISEKGKDKDKECTIYFPAQDSSMREKLNHQRNSLKGCISFLSGGRQKPPNLGTNIGKHGFDGLALWIKNLSGRTLFQTVDGAEVGTVAHELENKYG